MKSKKFLSIILLILIFAVCSTLLFACEDILEEPTLEEPTYSFKIMSYNVRTIAVEDTNERHWSVRSKLVINQINSTSPDVIGFQEFTLLHGLSLTEGLGNEYESITNFRKGASEGLMFMFKKERFELVEKNCYWLSETPEMQSIGWDASIERIAQVITLKDKQTGKQFTFINNHFDHKGSIAQLESAKLITTWLNQETPNFIFGDFNVEEDSAPYNELKKSLSNVKEVASVTMDSVTYNAYGDKDRENVIDHMFFNGSVIADKYSVLTDMTDGVYHSDHFPLLCIFSYK